MRLVYFLRSNTTHPCRAYHTRGSQWIWIRKTSISVDVRFVHPPCFTPVLCFFIAPTAFLAGCANAMHPRSQVRASPPCPTAAPVPSSFLAPPLPIVLAPCVDDCPATVLASCASMSFHSCNFLFVSNAPCRECSCFLFSTPIRSLVTTDPLFLVQNCPDRSHRRN